MSYFTIDATTPSKNHSSRNGSAIRMLVIHATAGSYASALAELTDPKPQAPDRRVSAHYLISKTGHIAQLVPDAQAAWHAGVSTWRGLNSLEIQACSLGVELENANTGSDPYPPIQIDALLWLSRILVAQYSIAQDMTVRHLDIAPKRKTDPAGFPWATFTAALFNTSTDQFSDWGAIGHPEGAAQSFAVPKAWLMNKVLGACVVPETYSASGRYSVTEFANGLIWYFKAKNTTEVRLF